jgi:RNA recognition motif-containing protein
MSVKLFVGGLPFSTSSDQLREVFAAVGSVESASVVTDRDTGRSRGFGFVEMSSNEDATNAVAQLNGSSLDGRSITVEVAKPAGSGGGGPRRSGGGGYGGARGGWTRGGR